MSFACGNVLAVLAAVCLPIFGGKWMAPTLNVATSRCFFALTIWGIPYVIGQCAQEDEWGSLWVQYHLLDLCYAPWGTALVMCAVSFCAHRVGRQVADEAIFMISFCIILAFGYLSEIWDTAWAVSAGYSVESAIDIGDYVTITAGGVVAAIFYVVFRKTTGSRAAS